MKRFVTHLVSILLLVGPTAALAETTVAREGNSVVGRDEARAERWRITHQLGEWLDPPAGPVTVDGRTFYAVASDLLELDVAEGRVIDRVRFPAPIRTLALAADDGLVVTLLAQARERRTEVPVRYRLGAPAPGRGFWADAITSQLQSLYDANQLVEGAAPQRAIEALAAAEARDATNPYFPMLRGEQLARAGRADEARAAFTRAAELPRATWQDLLRLSTHLEEAGQPAAARHAFARGLAGLRASGIRTERQTSLISLMVLYGRPQRALADAIRAGDLERVDELSERAYQICPSCELGDVAWADLARWLEATGRADLASKWRARARYAGSSLHGISASELAWLSAGAKATLVLLPLLAFAFGLRAGARRLGWRPRPLVRDAAAWLAVLGLGAVLHAGFAARTEVLGRHAGANLDLCTDAWDSPELGTYLARLPASAARDRLALYAQAERLATAAGTRSDLTPPTSVEIEEAMAAGISSPGLAPLGAALDRGWMIRIVGALLVGLVLGLRFGGRAERVASWLPGGPRSLVGFGGVIAACGLASAYVVLDGAPFDSSGSALGFFGLDALPVTTETSVGAILLLVAASVIHFAGALVDHRRAAHASHLERCGRLG